MKRIPFVALAVCALCIPVLAAADDLDSASSAYLQTMNDVGIAASPPGNGADVAVGQGHAVACPPGFPPLAPCGLRPREFRFAAASNLAAGVAEGVLFEKLLCVTPNCTPASVRARVICLTVNGNRAVIGLRAERSEGQAPAEGSEFLVSAVDVGRAGDPTPDLFSPNFNAPVIELEGQCLNEVPPAYMTVVEGEIQIRDGQVTSG